MVARAAMAGKSVRMLGSLRRDDANDVQGAVVRRGRRPCDVDCRVPQWCADNVACDCGSEPWVSERAYCGGTECAGRAAPHSSRHSHTSPVDTKSLQVQFAEIRRASERSARARCSVARDRTSSPGCPGRSSAEIIGNRAESGKAHGDPVNRGADLSGWRRLHRGPLHRRVD
jgi:hypothetical protein